jgi:hypothetical protein
MRLPSNVEPLKNDVFYNLINLYPQTLRIIVPSGMLRRVALVGTDVSEKYSSSIIRVTRIGELGT